MEKDNKDIVTENIAESNTRKITRKEAIRKTGYIAISVATMMILLSNPLKAHAADASPAPVSPWT